MNYSVNINIIQRTLKNVVCLSDRVDLSIVLLFLSLHPALQQECAPCYAFFRVNRVSTTEFLHIQAI